MFDQTGGTFSEAVAALTRILDQRNTFESIRAIDALRAIGPDAASSLPKIFEFLEHATLRQEIESAVAALAAIGPDEDAVASKLVDMATRDVASSRAWCIAALAEIGPNATPAVPLLMNILSGLDTTPEVSPIQAICALGRIGAGEALPALLKAAQTKAVLIDDGLGQAAVRAIVDLDPRAAIKAIPVLNSDTRYSNRWDSLQDAIDEIRANYSVF
jgi:hypothetical protein